MGFGLASWRYFSLQHIKSAAMFARQSGRIEKLHGSDVDNDVLATDQGFVVGAILSAVAFLEATINEVYLDAKVLDGGRIKDLPDETLEALAGKWEGDLPRRGALTKYRQALEAATARPMDEESTPAIEAALLITVRNDLIHYKPQLLDHGHVPNEVHELAEPLAGLGIGDNPLAHSQRPYYPDRFLGCEAAVWAVESAVRFVEAFFESLGVTPYHWHIRESLSTDPEYRLPGEPG